jgi:metallophosphoesterase (TIGR03767 family)
MSKSWLSRLILVTAVTLAGCGSSDESYVVTGPVGQPTATVVVNQPLFQGVPGRVDEHRFTGTDPAGQITYGPVTFDKAASIQLDNVPVSTTNIHIGFHDTDPEPDLLVGEHNANVELTPGETEVISNPTIDLKVALTTLDQSIVATGNGTYKQLAYGPAWTMQTREDLATAQEGRADRRQALMSVAHVSDIHLADSESPLRIEFLRAMTGFELPATEFQGAWRPQETLLTHVAESMVRQLNALASGPITGRPYDFAISTGDNSDNRHQNELERFISLLDGGTITPSSGDPNLYEGVQDQVRFDKQYWHPDPGAADDYKTTYGFPDYPGLLQAAVVPFQATGLQVPWYSVYGNHDFLLQGNFLTKAGIAPQNAMEAIATGSHKILKLPLFYEGLELLEEGSGVDLFLVEWLDPVDLTSSWSNFISRWTSILTPSRTVTADPKRHIVSRQEFAQAHLNSPASPGPVGHGFTADNISNDTLYYTFEPVPGVLGITLDTVNPGGEADGSLDQAQVAWLEEQLKAVHSQYYDSVGNLVQTGNQNKLVVLFSHHTLETLTNPLPDPNNPGPRVLNGVFEALLHRYPNVVLWMNGHSHICRVYPHADPSGRSGGFWEVNTPSHIDFPQQSRVVELADNKDGTLSIFATLIDHAAPPETTGGVTNDVLRLASISRELSANDPQIDRTFQLGDADDRNVELLIKRPFSSAP